MNNANALDDSIVAVASATGLAGRGIVRLSGPDSILIVSRLCAKGTCNESAKFQRRGAITELVIELPVDDGLFGSDRLKVGGFLLAWPDSGSYTGQIAAELHTGTSAPILEMIVERCCQLGARLARPGEFTLRSFLSGRIDLTQAEAVIGLIHAADESGFQTALNQFAGGLSAPFGNLREELLILLADLEAGLDFVEEDIEFVDSDRLRLALNDALEKLAGLQQQIFRRGNSDDLPEVVLAGLPNAGKSSLFNQICKCEAVIVSDLAGTTRDAVSRIVRIGDVEFRLTDTAGTDFGFRTDNDSHVGVSGAAISDPHSIETQALRHSRDAFDRADVVLLCVDGASGLLPDCRVVYKNLGDRGILVATRTDLGIHSEFPADSIQTSSLTGAGIEKLSHLIVEKFSVSAQNGMEVVPATLTRCRESLRIAVDELAQALVAVDSGAGDEVVAFAIRLALNSIGEISGEICNDDVLDRIFSRFCIGK